MVNEGGVTEHERDHRPERTRELVLESLKASKAPLSGEALGRTIGISRVAVWKAIQSLIRAGYSVESARDGYRLLETPADSLLPWEFSDYAGTVRHWDETDSTMNRAREAALSGAKDGTVILAERQSAGRGTSSRAWESPRGGLFFTLITKPSLHVTEAHREVLRMQCALADSLATRAAVETGVFWPNDVAVRARTADRWGKAAGVLSEYLVTGASVEYLSLGVGVNTGDAPSTPGAASVAVPRSALLRDALAAPRDPTDELVRRWNALCPLVGTRVSYRAGPHPPAVRGTSDATGVFLGADDRGYARISTEDGGERAFPPGSITLIDKGRNS